MISASVALAQPSATPEAPFLPYYWIRGTVTDGGSPAVNRIIVLYRDDLNTRIQTLTDNAGWYELNAYELYYYHGVPITFEAAVAYRVAAPRDSTHSTGSEEVINLNNGQGYTEVNMALVEGGGPLLITEVISGTVPLNILRNGNNIEVSWNNTLYPNPQIFMLTGSGSGEFTNSYSATKWVRIFSGGLVEASGISFTPPDTLVHQNQANGAGSGEVYYKGLQAGITDYATNIPSAEAVGKVNFTFGGGNTFFSVPLVLSGTINDIMGSQNYTAGSRLFKQAPDRSGFNTADYFSGTGWTDTIVITPDKGYYFYNIGSQIPVTLVGRVPGAGVSESMGGGNNLFAVQFPKQYDFSIFGAGTAAGDRVLIYNRNAIPVSGFDAVNQSEFGLTQVRLSGMGGYYYYRDPSAGTLTWSPPLP